MAAVIENRRKLGVVDRMKRKAKPQQQHLFMNENDYRLRLQEVLYTPDYILSKVFRKDGPPLGVEFDSPPSTAFPCARNAHCEENDHPSKRRKVSKQHPIVDYNTCLENVSLPKRHGIGKGPMTAMLSPTKKHGMGKGLMNKNVAPGKRHGIGKGLMTLWQVTNPGARKYPSGTNFTYNAVQKSKKRAQVQQRQTIVRKLCNRMKSKKKTCPRSRKAECKKVQKQKQPPKERCELALEDDKCQEITEHFASLVDDEELELGQARAGPNPLTCSGHFPTSGVHGCALCKDWLANFPPNSVKMKLPLRTQPWASSPNLVKKLFKAFHFICTYAGTVGMLSFTFDEFAQAFHEKYSLLLGQVHLALVRLLLCDIKKEIATQSSFANKNCRFRELLLSLEHRGIVLDFWQKSLNLLTCTEILRQVFVAAGYGLKHSAIPKKALYKEVNLLDKYGLSPGTLKGELFRILFINGNNEMQVSDLAKASSIVDINLKGTLEDQEDLITTTLSSDVTLFEKISSRGYRLRIHGAAKESEDSQSDSDDFGSIDDITEVTGGEDLDNNSEDESGNSGPCTLLLEAGETNSKMVEEHSEIDESQQGEAWLLGLMEGEYSDLSIEEKITTLTSLIDLLRAGSSINMEDPMVSGAECPCNINQYGSGGKVKRSMMNRCKSIGLFGSCDETVSQHHINISGKPIDSLVPLSKIAVEQNPVNLKTTVEQMKTEGYIHTMQSIFLGEDRRYNRYWLFLGPCDEMDPGHRRIYFECSEDGHWEVIDTREALCTLLSSLDQRGAREAHLLSSLRKRESILISNMLDGGNRQLSQHDQSELTTLREDSLSPVSDVDNRLGSSELQNNISHNADEVVECGMKVEQAEKSGCSQAFDALIWKSFYFELSSVKSGKKSHLNLLKRCDQCQDLYWKEEKHCRICHTTFELNFDLEERYAVHSAVCRSNVEANKPLKKKNLPAQLQSLKAAIYAIESVIPDEALVSSWRKSSHNLWVNRLRRASSLTEFLQVLADFVTAVNEDWFYQNGVLGSSSVLDEIFSNFSNMLQTYSSVALWLVKLDALVASCGILSSSESTKSHSKRMEGCLQTVNFQVHQNGGAT